MRFDYPRGATPLDPDEAEGLKPRSVETQEQLNAAEQANLVKAMMWLRRKKPPGVLTVEFLCELHKRMFGDVWRWAGTFRRTNKNLGIDHPRIPVAVLDLCRDTEAQIAAKAYSWDELGARFHHRLVAIHPFPNGNGRHARQMTGVLLELNGQEPFTWGAASEATGIGRDGSVRERYIRALQAADRGDFAPLIQFVRS